MWSQRLSKALLPASNGFFFRTPGVYNGMDLDHRVPSAETNVDTVSRHLSGSAHEDSTGFELDTQYALTDE